MKSLYKHPAANLAASNMQPDDYTGPTLTIKKHIITQQVNAFKQALPNVTPHYAVKANPLPQILKHLKQLGVKFEIASQGELSLLQALNIPAKDIVFSNPIKTEDSILNAKSYGITCYAFDTQEELKKLHRLVPDGDFELRLATSGEGSVWPLSIKFGLNDSNAIKLLHYAARKKINISGLTFHVGSQCVTADSWLSAIARCEKIFQIMSALSLPIKVLNIGGGFPCDPTQADTNQPALKSLMSDVKRALTQLSIQYPAIKVLAEPGRFLIAPAGTITCQIIATTKKHGKPWAFLDCGYYSGLMELTEEFGYKLISSKDSRLVPWTIAGPTCDSIDYFKPDYDLPETSAAGDIITISNMGAYSNACANQFNGFPTPAIHLL